MGGCSTKPKTTEFEGSMDPTFEDTVDEKGYSLQSLLLEVNLCSLSYFSTHFCSL
jgi:hypothetical protein